MNIPKIKELFCLLEEYLKDHGNNSIQSQYYSTVDTYAILTIKKDPHKFESSLKFL